MSLDKAQDVNQIAERIHGVLLSYGESVQVLQLAHAMELDIILVREALSLLEKENKAVKGIHGWKATIGGESN